MKPSRDAGRLSALAVNPNNRQASAARRTKLLAAFLGIDEDTWSNLMEATETMAFRLPSGVGLDSERAEALRIVRQMHEAAGLVSRS